MKRKVIWIVIAVFAVFVILVFACGINTDSRDQFASRNFFHHVSVPLAATILLGVIGVSLWHIFGAPHGPNRVSTGKFFDLIFAGSVLLLLMLLLPATRWPFTIKENKISAGDVIARGEITLAFDAATIGLQRQITNQGAQISNFVAIVRTLDLNPLQRMIVSNAAVQISNAPPIIVEVPRTLTPDEKLKLLAKDKLTQLLVAYFDQHQERSLLRRVYLKSPTFIIYNNGGQTFAAYSVSDVTKRLEQLVATKVAIEERAFPFELRK